MSTSQTSTPGSEAGQHGAGAAPATGWVAALATAAMRAPRLTVAIAFAFLVVCGALSAPLTAKLSAGGFLDPSTEGARAADVLVDDFGVTAMQMIFTVSAEDGATGPAATAVGTELVDRLRADPEVAGVQAPWGGDATTAALVGAQGRTAIVVVGLRGQDNAAMNAAHRLAERFVRSDGPVTVAAGGQALTYFEVNNTATEDGARAEMITLPLSLLLLALILRSALAAAIPVASGIVAIGGTVGILAVLAFTTDVSVFAVNVTGAMGLALAIDYALLIINRFRENLDEGASHDDAIVRAVASSGRAVVFSGVTVALSLLGSMFFPMYFLRTMAVAGVAVVLLSVLLALTCVPALLVLFGARIERRRRPAAPIESTPLYRLARFAQRRAVPVTLLIVPVLVLLGTPLLRLELGLPDDRVLPRDAAVHAVGESLREDFDVDFSGTVYLALPRVRAEQVAAVGEYAARISRLPGVFGVSGPLGTYVAGMRAASAAEHDGGAAYFAVATALDPLSEAGKDLLAAVHAEPEPVEVLVGGFGQQNADAVEGIERAFPYAAAWIVLSTFLLLLLMTGSVVLPLKAVVLNTLSLSASFGALVWVFQEGNLGGLGTQTTGTLVCTVPIVLFCSIFGLSMDYEVFLLSRFKEEWESSDRSRQANDRAVALGIARSGRVITAAALVMVVAFTGLLVSDVAIIMMLGVGLALAIVLDATVIRLLLVPAVMRLAGTWNWWAPAWMRPLLTKFVLQH